MVMAEPIYAKRRLGNTSSLEQTQVSKGDLQIGLLDVGLSILLSGNGCIGLLVINANRGCFCVTIHVIKG